MKLENWAFIRRATHECTGGLVLPQHYNLIHSYGAGCGYGRSGFEDGGPIATSKVIDFQSDKIITVSGSKYDLGKMHPDYKSFIEAYEKGVPILKHWRFSGGQIFGRIFENDNYELSEECDGEFVGARLFHRILIKIFAP